MGASGKDRVHRDLQIREGCGAKHVAAAMLGGAQVALVGGVGTIVGGAGRFHGHMDPVRGMGRAASGAHVRSEVHMRNVRGAVPLVENEPAVSGATILEHEPGATR